ncbi:MAG TPA: ATP-binding protein [Solirubrobacteraceae bacterium]|jgi:signal transduction histidine kinase
MSSHPANRPRGGTRIALGASLLVCSGLLFVRAAGPWPGDAIVWPAVIVALGALLIWRAPGVVPGRRRGWAAHRTSEPSPPSSRPAREPSARMRVLGRPEVSRGGLGVALVLAGGLAFLWANGALRPAGETVLAAVAVLVAVALIFAPSWRRLARSLAAERTERIRSQERADVGAHLHDSVLQTLALIQRSAEDPGQVTALARRQERELRGWLEDGDAPGSGDGGRLAGALAAAAGEVEAAVGGTVEVVAVGDRALDERAGAVLGAAREAMLNAAKFAGQAPISVYAELSDERIQVFVRDRGAGFDPATVPPARRGVRESIVGRMNRAGGRAVVRSQPGGGIEVEIAIDGGDRS